MKNRPCECGPSRLVTYAEGVPYCSKCGRAIPERGPSSAAEQVIADAIAREVSESLDRIALAPATTDALAASIATRLLRPLADLMLEAVVEAKGKVQEPIKEPERRWATTREVAVALGRGEDYVRDHADELGGWKQGSHERGQWRFPISLTRDAPHATDEAEPTRTKRPSRVPLLPIEGESKRGG